MNCYQVHWVQFELLPSPLGSIWIVTMSTVFNLSCYLVHCPKFELLPSPLGSIWNCYQVQWVLIELLLIPWSKRWKIWKLSKIPNFVQILKLGGRIWAQFKCMVQELVTNQIEPIGIGNKQIFDCGLGNKHWFHIVTNSTYPKWFVT